MLALLWDQHTCLPLRPDADISELTRYRRPGGAFISVNVGYAPQRLADVLTLLENFRRGVQAHPDLELADTDAVADRDKITVAFDLEDCAPLEGDLANVRRLAELGVRTMLPTYNHANIAGCGCLDAHDTGLTAWGRALIAEMNAVGMVPDGSHCSIRTGLDICGTTTRPAVYSHSCMRTIWDHPRNITDDQAKACASTGGVIGITGVGIFLGPNTPTLEAMTRHIEYAVELVGIDHVGISTDFSFDHGDWYDEIAANSSLFDESYTRWGPIQWMPPETFVGLGHHLSERGWSDADVAAVLSGNFRRVAEQTWLSP
ncbi:MAG TPA: membrane dipeptidase [Mycobacterium sp.]|uniref:dipeptidase n=1 Tax=Mycobacterium sp. TaxID=1785 RepID=UPI002D48E27F|nr:membrane dipeptidase [Mycobacterium sp.]HZU49808.1 membrane dipeptidase [Mycobacterium sp.]